ncbi:MAG TPA: alpha/beta fold hydrolase [Candidatus Acidoferrum sp.]|nr:alpha/beta fold hydrolase [Candidatus Acidoferrum sp.]
MSISLVDFKSEPAVRGFLHEPARPNGDAVVLTHGAGADCQSKLLVEISEALAASGFSVLRFDLPFRLARPHGPPSPGSANRDRDGLRQAVAAMREKTKGRVFMGGHSYGGRQASMLASEEAQLVDGLLLLSYPLHPPRKPEQLRAGHFPKLATAAFFVHGTRDPFGTVAEMKSALELIPGSHALFEVPSAGHEILPKKDAGGLLIQIVDGFHAFLKTLT